MQRLLQISGILLIITGFLGCTVFGIRSGYEQLEYKVVEKVGEIEIRQYPARLVAEVNQAKDDNEAFRLLFKYISGNNVASQKISMTAPVEVNKTSQKISMTTPVEVSQSVNDGTGMRFFLPNTYTADNAPIPKDSRIKIISLPAETIATLAYSGFDSNESYKQQSERLLQALSSSTWKPISTVSFLGYDPPFTIPFFRRNEVTVRVELE